MEIKWEAGVIPARSRHCNGEFLSNMPLGLTLKGVWEGAKEMMSLSQDTCLFSIFVVPTVYGRMK